MGRVMLNITVLQTSFSGSTKAIASIHQEGLSGDEGGILRGKADDRIHSHLRGGQLNLNPKPDFSFAGNTGSRSANMKNINKQLDSSIHRLSLKTPET